MSKIIIKDNYENKINMKYIYYYLLNIKRKIEETYQKGSCNKSLDIDNFNRMKLPIPSLEEQSKIILNIIALENSTKNLKIAIEANLMNRKMYMEAMIKGATNKGLNKVMKLGEVCEINNGKNITESQFIDGDYPVIGGGRNYIGYHNEYNAPENTITISKDGSCGIILLHKTKIFVSNHGFYISSINTNIVKKNYFYNYLLLIENVLSSYGKGSSQQGINKDDLLKKVKIPIPSLDYQNKMEQTLSNLDKLDEELNKMIQQNEDNIKTAFLNSLDDYGNPNSFNIDKLIQSDSEEEIKEVPKNKNKTKSKSNVI
jgi:restriction endonuclease S subunit